MYAGSGTAWSSKKQPQVALSTTEAEYIVLTHAGKHRFEELGQNTYEATHIHCDNQAITNTCDPTRYA